MPAQTRTVVCQRSTAVVQMRCASVLVLSPHDQHPPDSFYFIVWI